MTELKQNKPFAQPVHKVAHEVEMPALMMICTLLSDAFSPPLLHLCHCVCVSFVFITSCVTSVQLFAGATSVSE